MEERKTAAEVNPSLLAAWREAVERTPALKELENLQRAAQWRLDYVAAEKEFGKAIGMDIKEGKITLPLIRTLARCSADEKETIRGIVERKQATEDDIGTVFRLIGNYDGIPYALDRARTIIAEGKARLAPFHDGEAKAALLAMADFIAERTL